MKIRKEIDEDMILSKDIVMKAIPKRIKLNDDEIFLPIEGYDNCFISNYGWVLDFNHKPALKTIYQDKSKKNNRYYYVRLGKDYKKEYIHTLVAYAFCEIPDDKNGEKLQVHHIKKFIPKKSNEINNRADNLLIIKKSQHATIEAIKAIRITYLRSLKVDFVTGKLKQKPERYSFSNILDVCDYLKINLDDFIQLILKKKPKYIGEVAETSYYNNYLINVVRYKPKINKKLKFIPGHEHGFTIDKW